MSLHETESSVSRRLGNFFELKRITQKLAEGRVISALAYVSLENKRTLRSILTTFGGLGLPAGWLVLGLEPFQAPVESVG